jgi:hypothetical protein
VAKIEVEYIVKVRQKIDWPDDEMDDFNYDNLEANLDPNDSDPVEVENIITVKVNGKNHNF